MSTRLAYGRVRQRVQKGRGMEQGLVYVEAYLPFDAEAFAGFVELVGKQDGKTQAERVSKAALADPDLCAKALDPVDTHGEAMLQDDVVALAHRFVTQSSKMDVMHDRVARGSVAVVETFVNTPEIASPHFWPGAWVVVLKVDPGTPEWDDLEAGKLDAVSFQGVVTKVPVTVTVKESP